MFKKLFLLGVGAAGALAVTNAVWSGSVHTAWKKARTVVESQVSPEFELERIRDQIAKLTPDMNRHIEKIAEATVEVGSLNRRIEIVKNELDRRQADILALTDKVESGIQKVSFGGTNLKDKLARDLKSYKSCEKDLATKQRLLEAKKEALESARRQLTEIHNQRAEMEVLAAQYEVRLAELREAQTRSKFKLDDSRLAKIKEAFEKLQARIDVENTKAELAGQFTTAPTIEPTVSAEPAKDVVQEVRDLFGKKESAKHTTD